MVSGPKICSVYISKTSIRINNLPMVNLLSLIETHNTRNQSEKIAINFKYNYEALIPQKQVR